MSRISKIFIVEIWSISSVPVHPIKSLSKPNYFVDSFGLIGELNTFGHGRVADRY